MTTKRIILYIMIGLVVTIWLGAYAIYSIDSFMQALIVIVIVAIIMTVFWSIRAGLRDRQTRMIDAEKTKLAEEELALKNKK